MTDNALEIKGLGAKVGNFELSDISFSIERGTIMGFVGKNGAGKTTLIKTILNMIPSSTGEVLFDGLKMEGNETTVKSKVGVVFDSTIYPMNLKPKQIMKMFAPFYKDFNLSRFDELMNRFKLDPKKKLITYSKGMQMKFSILMALCHNPDLLILDEPTAGLDPVAKADVLDLLLEIMQNEGKSVLFSTHIISDLEKIADYITWIDNGHIVFSKDKNLLLDEFVLVNVEKSVMTDEIASKVKGLRESTFAFTGLASKNDFYAGREGIKIARPTIEDIMIYTNGIEGDIYA